MSTQYTVQTLQSLPSKQLLELWCKYRAANDMTRPFNITGERRRRWEPGRIAIYNDDERHWEFADDDDGAKAIVFRDSNNYQL